MMKLIVMAAAMVILADSANALDLAGKSAPLNDATALPPAVDLTPYLQELDHIKRLQRETLELKQQLEVEKLRAELLKQRDIKQAGQGSPYVLALTGSSQLRQARLMLPGYGEIMVRAGDLLPGNWRIESIDDHAVQARHKQGPRVQLPFHSREP